MRQVKNAWRGGKGHGSPGAVCTSIVVEVDLLDVDYFQAGLVAELQIGLRRAGEVLGVGERLGRLEELADRVAAGVDRRDDERAVAAARPLVREHLLDRVARGHQARERVGRARPLCEVERRVGLRLARVGAPEHDAARPRALDDVRRSVAVDVEHVDGLRVAAGRVGDVLHEGLARGRVHDDSVVCCDDNVLGSVFVHVHDNDLANGQSARPRKLDNVVGIGRAEPVLLLDGAAGTRARWLREELDRCSEVIVSDGDRVLAVVELDLGQLRALLPAARGRRDAI